MNTSIAGWIAALAGAVYLSVGSAAAAPAGKCVRAYVCDDKGKNCKHQDVCPTYEQAEPPKTRGLALPPADPGKPVPLGGMNESVSKPVGASGCEYQRVNGEWKSACAPEPITAPPPEAAKKK